jgi:hypothetical protein
VPGSSSARGGGPPRRFLVEVERDIGVSTAEGRRTAAFVERTLLDRRGWTGPGGTALKRVSRGPAEIRVTLVSPGTTDELCAPLQTGGRYSCWHGGRAILNLMRWRRGVRGYRNLADYRRYMVNHEVGHGLGHGHTSCPGRGRRAPVMLQQSKGLDGCRPGPWPRRTERVG